MWMENQTSQTRVNIMKRDSLYSLLEGLGGILIFIGGCALLLELTAQLSGGSSSGLPPGQALIIGACSIILGIVFLALGKIGLRLGRIEKKLDLPESKDEHDPLE